MKNDAVSELRIYLTANGITAKEAISILYQPTLKEDEDRKLLLRSYTKYASNKGGLDSDSDTDKEEKSQESEKDFHEMTVLHAYDSDEDEDRNYGNDVAGLKAFSGRKTDIELNAGGRQRGNSISKMPTKTPNGANSDNQHVWAVSWKPKPQ